MAAASTEVGLAGTRKFRINIEHQMSFEEHVKLQNQDRKVNKESVKVAMRQCGVWQISQEEQDYLVCAFTEVLYYSQ